MELIEFHPLANIFPLIEGASFDELVADIRNHGVREPIWLLQGQIIDGRNRYRASAAAGVDCPMREYMGDDPVAFVLSMNLNRRHLNDSQRAMVAAKIANLPHGGDAYNRTAQVPLGGVKQSDAAAVLNVGERTVRAAKAILRDGTEEEIKLVEEGQASVRATEKKVRKRKTGKGDLSAVGGNVERIEKARIKAEIWGHVRDAINHLTSLPMVEDAVVAARASDKSGLVDRKLSRALKYLEEFSHAWNNQGHASNNHTANSDGIAREEQAQPAA